MAEEKEEKQTKEEKQKTVLEETKEAIAQLKSEREAIEKVREDLTQLRSDQLLSGTGGIRKEPEPPKEETASEYKDRIMSGRL